jgi:ribosomal protein S12 methylthiotransferase accessory factor
MSALVLRHDGSCSATLAALGRCLPTPHRCERWDDADAGAQDASRVVPGDTVVLLFDLLHIEAAVAAQQQALRAGASVFVIGLEPGSLMLGPWVEPGQNQGCLHCLRGWIANNHREPTHWATTPAAQARRGSQAPWPAGAEGLLVPLLADAGLRPGATRRGGQCKRIDWSDFSVTHHRYLRDSACPACAEHAPLPPDSAERARLQLQPRPKARPEDTRHPNPRLSAAALRERFVDRRSGLVQRVFHDLTSTLTPMFGAEMPIRGSATIERGFGRAATRAGSEQVAQLELLERYCGHQPRGSTVAVRGSYERLRERLGSVVVNPADFVLHEAWQYDAAGFWPEPYSPALEFDWCWAHSMRENRAKLVPLQLAYYWLAQPPGRPVNRFAYDSSSGCALGGSVEEAALHGLYEVLERDAYLTRWWGRLAPRPIVEASIADPDCRALIARARAQGYEVHVFDMRLDIELPMALAMIVDPRRDAPVKSYCASAAGAHWGRAIFGALVEVTSAMAVYAQTMPALRDKARAMVNDASLVQEMHDHVILYSAPESWPKLSFLFGGQALDLRTLPQRPQQADITVELQRLVQATLAVASDVLVVQQGFAALHELGLSCVKVLAPGLTPVTFGHHARRVDLARVNAAARSQGRAPLAAHELNPEPHNFP